MGKHNIQSTTPAKRAGVALEVISEALTHSDKEIVNTKDKVNQTVGDIAFCSLKN